MDLVLNVVCGVMHMRVHCLLSVLISQLHRSVVSVLSWKVLLSLGLCRMATHLYSERSAVCVE